MSNLFIKIYHATSKNFTSYIDFSDAKNNYLCIETIDEDGFPKNVTDKKVKIGDFEFEYQYSNVLLGFQISFGLAVELLNYLSKTKEFFSESGWHELFEKFNNQEQILLSDFDCDEFEPKFFKKDKNQLSVFQ